MSSFLYTNTLYLGVINYHNKEQTYQLHPPTVLKEQLGEVFISQLVYDKGLFTDEIINKLKEINEKIDDRVKMFDVIRSNDKWDHVDEIMAPIENEINKLEKELNELDKFIDDNVYDINVKHAYKYSNNPENEYYYFKNRYYLTQAKLANVYFEDFLKTLPNYGTVWDFEIKEITINTLYSSE